MIARSRPSVDSQLRHELARASRITSSRVATIMTGSYKAWNTLAKEMREAVPAPMYSGKATGVPALDWGHQHEDQACELFWLRHPEYEMEDERWLYWHDPRNAVFYELCGTSPDRTLFQRAQRVSGLEAKCPYDEEIYRRYRLEDRCPPEYRPQICWHMIVSDLPHWYFVAFNPREREDFRYVECKIYRDYIYEGELMERVNRFIGGYLAGETFKPAAPTAADFEALFGATTKGEQQ